MVPQTQPEMTAFDPSVVKSGGSSDFSDYVKLPAEEPIGAHLVDIKMKANVRNQFVPEGDPKEFITYLYFYFEVADGEGKGQRYRYRTTAVLATKPKKSNYYALLETLGLDPIGGIRNEAGTLMSGVTPVLGTPARIELSDAAKNEKGLQFINVVKKATSSQKRIEVKSQDAVPDDIDPEEIKSFFDDADASN